MLIHQTLVQLSFTVYNDLQTNCIIKKQIVLPYSGKFSKVQNFSVKLKYFCKKFWKK